MEASLQQTARPRLWVGIVTPQDVVARGLRTILEEEIGADAGTDLVVTVESPDGELDGAPDGDPDVVLYDAIGLLDGGTTELDHWVKDSSAVVVAVSQDLRPDLASTALARGARAAVSVGASAHDLAEVVTAAVAGNLEEVPAAQEGERFSRLGGGAGLSDREVDVLSLIVCGVSNQTIASTLFLSVNSVKTYIRSTYRKAGVDNRAQAVAWALAHGFRASDDPLAPRTSPR